MVYKAIDTFYLTDEQLTNSPSRKDGIDEVTETTLRIYGCDLIQESGILLRLPLAAMATGQVLFHRFYCKKSFARFDVKKVAASCVWLGSRKEENRIKLRQVIIVFHRMECKRENLPMEHLDLYSKKYFDLETELSITEKHILKELAFICHVELPHKLISSYLTPLDTPLKLVQEAWNLANDSLRTTLCVRFKSEVVACGVVYAAARRFHVPLPENPPWWKTFDADKSGIDEVCRVLAHLCSLPKAQYISVCKNGDFTFSNKSFESKSQSTAEDVPQSSSLANTNTSEPKGPSREANVESIGGRDGLIKLFTDKLKNSKISDDGKLTFVRFAEREKRREIGKGRGKEKDPGIVIGVGILTTNVNEENVEREKLKVHGHRSRKRENDSGHLEKSKRHSSRIMTTPVPLTHQGRKIGIDIIETSFRDVPAQKEEL
ncbi:Cyclin-L1-1 [Orobanche gracilis]